MTRKIIERAQDFWARVKKTETCWLWEGACDKDGYGKFLRGKAHRVAWELRTDMPPDPESMILHTCDQPPCVRNDEDGWYEIKGIIRKRYGHLVLGTHADNQRDAIQKGRKVFPKGEACSWAKLQAADIIPIFQAALAGQSQTIIAATFHVTQSTITSVLTRQRWQSVEVPETLLTAYAARQIALQTRYDADTHHRQVHPKWTKNCPACHRLYERERQQRHSQEINAHRRARRRAKYAKVACSRAQEIQ